MTQHHQQQLPATGTLTADGTGKAVGARRTVSRWWSRRRIPAALLALVLTVACGALLFDTIRVRSGHTAAAWRKSLTHELATRPLNDPWVLAGAALAAVTGLCLIIIALTPGRRHLLPLAGQAARPDVEAVLERDGAAVLLRDAALQTPGVSEARIRVRRRHITARAQASFRDLATVESELTDTLNQQLTALGLATSPRLTVQVRPRAA